jgi:unsaturated rhamnogalacturonyl hydrolase
VYTLAKGVRLGYLDPAFRKTALNGYDGIRKEFLHTDAAGALHLDGTVSVSGLGGKPFRDGSFGYYMKEKVIRDDAKGVGAFIQASNEIETIAGQKLGAGKRVILDSYFNNEHDKDMIGNARSSHYKWEERSNGGFQFWDRMLTRYGATTQTLYKAPDGTALKGAAGYIIVDPDIVKENPEAKFMDERSATAIADWVKTGGRLVLLLNDSGNCDLSHMNILTRKFGFEFNEDSRNHVDGRQFEQGALVFNQSTPVLTTARKVYLKEISTIRIADEKMGKPVFKDKGDVLMVEAVYGKGRVFAVGDPWIYNEYVDGRKLPADFENFKAMDDLTRWLLAR